LNFKNNAKLKKKKLIDNPTWRRKDFSQKQELFLNMQNGGQIKMSDYTYYLRCSFSKTFRECIEKLRAKKS
jgi:hypothetical protein